MSDLIIFGLAVCEAISLFWIYYLWTQKRHVAFWERSLLTIALLVPIAGWVFYVFIMNSPDEHPDRLPVRDDGHGGSSHHSSDSSDSH